MSEVTIHHLAFLAGRERILFLSRLLTDPTHVLGTASSPEDFVYGLARLERGLGRFPATRQLAALAMATSLLLHQDRFPLWMGHMLGNYLDIERFFTPASLKDLLAGRWKAAAVPMVLGEGRIRHIICGLAPVPATEARWPLWAPEVMDADALEAIWDAGRAAAACRPVAAGLGFFSYPLATPNRSVQFRGRSLGLAVALAFLGLLSVEPSRGDLLATGDVGPEGGVRPVRQLDAKMAVGLEAGFRLFLFPSSNEEVPRTDGVEALPVNNLKEARMLSGLHQPGRSRELQVFASMIKDPDFFLTNCARVPHEWMLWLANEKEGRAMAESIAASTEHLVTWAGKLKRLIYRGKLNAADALSGLIGPDLEDIAIRTSPSSVLSVCTWRMVLAQRRGRVVDSHVHSSRAEALLAQGAGAADPDAAAVYWNHRLLASHTRYEFRPDLPPGLQETLTMLEERFAGMKKSRCLVLPSLGALYGTLAQHSAFCGPAHLDDTVRYARLAMEAFGGEAVAEYEEDRLRQRNYLVYAFLDAEDRGSAERQLLIYMKRKTLGGLPGEIPGADPWRKALALRFIADVGQRGIMEETLAVMSNRLAVFQDPYHPAPLSLFNLGRVASKLGEEGSAEFFWRKSLDLCLSRKNGPSVKVQGLLPLAGLHALGLIPDQSLSEAFQNLRRAAMAFNIDHFSLLFQEEPLERLLSHIMQEQKRLFPFSYR